MEVQLAFCIAKQHLVATFSIDVFVNKQISFQNKFSGGARVCQIPHQHKYDYVVPRALTRLQFSSWLQEKILKN